MSLGLRLSIDGYVTFHVRDPINYPTLHVTSTVEAAIRQLVESGIAIEDPDLNMRVRHSLLVYHDHNHHNNENHNLPRFTEKHIPQVRALIWNALVQCGLPSQYQNDEHGGVFLLLHSFRALVKGKRDTSFDEDDASVTDYPFGILYFKAQYPYMDFEMEQKIETLQESAQKEEWLAEEAQTQLQQGRVGAVQTVRLRRAVKAYTARAQQLQDEALRLRYQRDFLAPERKQPSVNGNHVPSGHEPVTSQSSSVNSSSQEITSTAKKSSHYIPAHLLSSSSNSASSQPQTYTATNAVGSDGGNGSNNNNNSNHPLIEAIRRANFQHNSASEPVAFASLAMSPSSQSASREVVGSQPHPKERPLHDTHVPLVATTLVPSSILYGQHHPEPTAMASFVPMNSSGGMSQEYAEGGGGGGTVTTAMTAMDSSSSPPLQIFATPSEDARSIDGSAVTQQTFERNSNSTSTAAAAAGLNQYPVSSTAERLQRRQDIAFRNQRYQSFRERLQRLMRIVRTDHQQRLARESTRRQTLLELGTWVEGSPLETKTNFRSKVYAEIDQLSSSYSKKYESNIVEMVVRWEASVAAQLKAEIKSAKTIYSTLDHYEEKVVSLQHKYTRQPTGTDAAQNWWSKLERNQHKLQEAAAEYANCRDRLERLDKTMEHDWMLIFPLLVKLLQSDMDEAKERASVMALLEDSLREMSEAVQRHGLDPKVSLNSLEMWSVLSTGGVAAAPTSVNDAAENAGVAADASTDANIQETSSAVPEDHVSVGSDQRQQQVGSEHGLDSISGTTQQPQWTVQSSEEDSGAGAVTHGISIPAVETAFEIGELSVPAAELINNDDSPQHRQRRVPVDPSVIVMRDENLPSPADDQGEPPRQTLLDTGNPHEDRGAGLVAQDMSILAAGGPAEMDESSVPAAELINSDDSHQPSQRRIPVDPSVIVMRDENPPSPAGDQVEPPRQTILETGNARVDVANVTEIPYTESSALPHQQLQPVNATVTGIRAESPPVVYRSEPLTPSTLDCSDIGEPKHPGSEESFVVIDQEDRDKVLERDCGSSSAFFQAIDDSGSHPLPIYLPSTESVAEAVGNRGDYLKNEQIDTGKLNNMVGGSFLKSSLEVEAATEASTNHFADTIDATAAIGGIRRGFEPDTDDEEKLFDHDAECVDDFLSEICATKPTVHNVTNEHIDSKEDTAGGCKTEAVDTPKRGCDPPEDDEFMQYRYESDDNESELSRDTEAVPTNHHPVFSEPEVLDSPLVDLGPVNDNLYMTSEPGEIVNADINGNADEYGNSMNESVDYFMEPNNHVDTDADADDFADVLDAAALVDGSQSLILECHPAAEVEEGSRIGYMC